MIYHIVSAESWQSAQAAGVYSAESLTTEGFIHFSTRAQVIATANRYYHGHSDLLLLAVDVAALRADLVYENTTGGSEPFPHLYGPLNLDAVRHVWPLVPAPDGRFAWSPAWP